MTTPIEAFRSHQWEQIHSQERQPAHAASPPAPQDVRPGNIPMTREEADALLLGTATPTATPRAVEPTEGNRTRQAADPSEPQRPPAQSEWTQARDLLDRIPMDPLTRSFVTSALGTLQTQHLPAGQGAADVPSQAGSTVGHHPQTLQQQVSGTGGHAAPAPQDSDWAQAASLLQGLSMDAATGHFVMRALEELQGQHQPPAEPAAQSRSVPGRSAAPSAQEPATPKDLGVGELSDSFAKRAGFRIEVEPGDHSPQSRLADLALTIDTTVPKLTAPQQVYYLGLLQTYHRHCGGSVPPNLNALCQDVALRLEKAVEGSLNEPAGRASLAERLNSRHDGGARILRPLFNPTLGSRTELLREALENLAKSAP